MKYDHLLGRAFKHGSADCYGLIRDFYRDIYDLELTNYARPDMWWDHGFNLYIDYVEREGFRIVDVGLEPGDIIMMAIKSPVANHGAIYVGDNKILHHFPNSLSVVEGYKGMFRNRTVAIYRHPAVAEQAAAVTEEVDLMTLLPPTVRQRLEEARRTAGNPANLPAQAQG